MAEASKENEEKNVGKTNSFSRLLLSPMRSPSSKTKRTSSSKSFRRFFGSKKRDDGDVRDDEPTLPEPVKEIVQDVIDMAQDGPLAHKDDVSSLAKSVTSSTDNYIERTIKVLDDSKNELKGKPNQGIETANKSLEDVKETVNKSLEDVKETANKSLEDVKETANKSLGEVQEIAQRSFDNAKETANKSLEHAKEKAPRSLGSFMDKFKHKENKPQEVVQQKVEETKTIDENKKPLQPIPGHLEKVGHINHVPEEVGVVVDAYIADQSSKVTEESLSKEGEEKKNEGKVEEKEVVLEREDNCVASLAQGLTNICASWSPKKEY